MRPGEAAALQWEHVRLRPAVHAKLGYIHIAGGKSKNAKRNLSLTARAAEMLKTRRTSAETEWVFPSDNGGGHFLGTSLDHQHDDVREA